MTLAFDENLPPNVSKALALVGYPVTHVLDHLPRGTPDAALFVEAAKRDWVIVTRDAKMWRKKGQLAALRAAGIGVVVVVSSVARSPAELLALFSKRMPAILDAVEKTRKPFVLRLPDKGKIESF